MCRSGSYDLSFFFVRIRGFFVLIGANVLKIQDGVIFLRNQIFNDQVQDAQV